MAGAARATAYIPYIRSAYPDRRQTAVHSQSGERSLLVMQTRAASLLVLLAAAGCGAPAAMPIPSLRPLASLAAEDLPASCRGAAVAAESVAESEDAVGALDDVIRACPTLEEWLAATNLYSAALRGTSATQHLANRCAALQGLAATPLCRDLHS